jgi:hypothetical protein
LVARDIRRQAGRCLCSYVKVNIRVYSLRVAQS